MFKHTFKILAVYLAVSVAHAADNPLSVHVLSTQDGLPAPGVTVILEQMKNGAWVKLKSAETNQQGRIPDLYPEGKKLELGEYKVRFETGDWYKQRHVDTFFPEIPIVFNLDGKLKHYHIPLLLSPFGYSTYRGN